MFTHIVAYVARVNGESADGIAQIETEGINRPSWAQMYRAIPGYIKGEYLGCKQVQFAITTGRLHGTDEAQRAVQVLSPADAQAMLDAMASEDPEIRALAVPPAPEATAFYGARQLVQRLYGYLDGEDMDRAEEVLWPYYQDGWQEGYMQYAHDMARAVLDRR